MRVMIDIPKEFETDLQDRFNEFFERVKYDINSLWELQEVSMCGNYERETAEMFLSAFEKATVIPDDATNGDVIKAMFPDIEFIETVCVCGTSYVRVLFNGMPEFKIFDLDWWNAPYEKEVKE